MTSSDLSGSLNDIIVKRKQGDGEFCYVYISSGEAINGKKAAFRALQADEDVYQKLKETCKLKNETDAAFDARVLKLLVSVPFETAEQAAAAPKSPTKKTDAVTNPPTKATPTKRAATPLSVLSKVIAKRKLEEGEFTYVYIPLDKVVNGKKAMYQFFKCQEEFSKLKDSFKEENETDEEFDSRMMKEMIKLSFEKEGKAPTNGSTKNDEQEEPVVDEVDDSDDAEKIYPLTLDFMKVIDERTTKIPNYGSLAGRISRLLGLVLVKDEENKIIDRKSKKVLENPAEVYSFIEAEYNDFLENMCTMFPPAKKRIGQFIEKAAADNDLKVPTLKLVDKLQKIESDRLAAERKKEMEEKLAKAKAAREEMLKRRKEEEEKRKAAREELMKKRKEEEEKRKALKRKQAEEARLNELKLMKLSPNIERVDEILKQKKEIGRIEKALEGKFVKESNRKHLKERLSEVQEKLKTMTTEIREKRVNKRMETCLENLSPKQLRKLSMEYFNNIDNLQSVSWTQMCQGVKIEDDFEFLTDFLGCLYELASLHKKGFKVGHILVTSKQTEAILNNGVKSIRDNIKDTFRIPDTWNVESPDAELGITWSSINDAQLLIGAAKFGKNLMKIVTENSELSAFCLDDNKAIKEAIRKRFAHLINVYINKGIPSSEFGYTLYSVDVEDGEEIIEEDEEEESSKDEKDEVVEITTIDDDDDVKIDEDKENKDKNGVTDEENKADMLGEDNDEIIEDIDDKLLDEAD